MGSLRVRVNGTDSAASPTLSVGGPNRVEAEGDVITSATTLLLPSITGYTCAWSDAQPTRGVGKISRRFTFSKVASAPLGLAAPVVNAVDDDGSMTVTIDHPRQTIGPFGVMVDIRVVVG